MMEEYPMHDYHQLSNDSDDSDSSDNSIGQPPSFKVLEKHGHTVNKEYEQGVSGKVFLTNKEGVSYVVKEIYCRDKKSLHTVRNEVKIMESLKHGYIVSYVDSFEDKEAGFLYIVMEYCAGGDLSNKMKTQNNLHFTEEQIIDWLVQICLALEYIHEKNVLHRDIKPQNIFLTEDGYINLGDFGCSKILQRADAYAGSVVGAELYRSPEVYRERYNHKSDIWSLGWLLHDLCMLDVWSDIIERRYLHVLSMKGNLPLISERYSENLRELIQEMLSCDPEHRPSAEEILARPFLSNAVYRNKRLPEELEQRLMNSIWSFDEAYNEHYRDFETLVKEWGETTDSLERIHYNTTAGALAGSVIGAAGGITALVGLILSPFTFGASLIVSGVGVGVGVAGGVTGAASSITNAVIQKSLHERLEKIQQNYENTSEPILNSLNALRKELKIITKFSDFVNDSTFDKTSCNVGKDKGTYIVRLMNLGLLANLTRIGTQTARVGRVAAEAVSGVVSGLLLIVDFIFIYNDSQEIHQMRTQWNTDDPEKVRSEVLKSVARMRKTHKDLCEVLKGIKESRECAVKIKEDIATA